MLATYVTVALIFAASLLVGRAIMALCGRDRWTGMEPAVGFAALMAVGGFLARLPWPGRLSTLGVLALLGLSLLALRLPFRMRPGSARSWIAVLLTVAACSIPFLISGRWGLIGVGVNNDLGLHLAWADWITRGVGTTPDGGYPLGPHALAAAFARLPGLDLAHVFIGELIAITALTSLTALSALRGMGPARQVFGATLVALPYLAASYLAQAAFKETALALFVLAFAIAMPLVTPLPAGRRERLLTVAPLLVVAAGIVFTYSFAGLAWPIGIVALWALSRPGFRRALRPSLLLRPAVLLSLLALAALGAVLAFVGPFGFGDSFSAVAGSNTYGPVSVIEALGVWPDSDYRLQTAGDVPLEWLCGAVAVLALVAALVWWLRRGELSLPLAFAACAVIYLASLPISGDYSLAKALTVASPLVMLLIARALLSGPAGGWRVSAGRARAGRLAWGALTLAFLGGAVASSLLVLRDVSVAPAGHGSELAAFDRHLSGKTVLYGGQDRFAQHHLSGAQADVPIVEFPNEDVAESPTKPFDTGDAYSPIDFDSFDWATLQHHDWVITSAAAWDSEAPPNFREVARTPSYVLWHREGPTPEDRRTLIEGVLPAAPVKCVEPETKILVGQPGTATVFPDARVGSSDAWEPSHELAGGEGASQTIYLTPGTWSLSLQYFSPFGLTLSARGFEHELEPALDGQRPAGITLVNNGQFWPAGRIEVEEAGRYRFDVEAPEPSFLRDVTGYSRKSYVGQIAAVRDAPRQTVPIRRACGRWIDHYVGSPSP